MIRGGSEIYLLPAMPHALGSSGAQRGIGRALVLAMVALIVVALEAEADEICVEAAAPVMARTTMKARTIFFTTDYLLSCIYV